MFESVFEVFEPYMTIITPVYVLFKKAPPLPGIGWDWSRWALKGASKKQKEQKKEEPKHASENTWTRIKCCPWSVWSVSKIQQTVINFNFNTHPANPPTREPHISRSMFHKIHVLFYFIQAYSIFTSLPWWFLCSVHNCVCKFHNI